MKSILVINNEIFLDGVVKTYEKLCKEISKNEKINIVVLSSYLYFKELELISIDKINKQIEREIIKELKEKEFLFHREIDIIKRKIYFYGIKGSETILKLYRNFNKVKITPIQFFIKNYITRKKRRKNYKCILECGEYKDTIVVKRNKIISCENEDFIDYKFVIENLNLNCIKEETV